MIYAIQQWAGKRQPSYSATIGDHARARMVIVEALRKRENREVVAWHPDGSVMHAIREPGGQWRAAKGVIPWHGAGP